MTRKQPDVPDIASFMNAYREETDRGAGILGGALLDLYLDRLFRARLAPDTPSGVFEFRGPLGDFAARIDLAFALRWIDAEARDDMHSVRRIRNDFAHQADHALTFAHPSIAARTHDMHVAEWVRRMKDQTVILLGNSTGTRDEFIDRWTRHVGNARTVYTLGVAFLSSIITDLTSQPHSNDRLPISLQSSFKKAEGDTQVMFLSALAPPEYD
jgi:hypothetical protein